MASTIFTVLAGALIVARANAETHTIQFDNQCGYGTPTLLQGGQVLSTGEDYTSNGPFESGIAYLQTGNCLYNGENCTLMEMTLGNPNPAVPGSGSSSDISLIPPHAFSVPTSFSYYGGCDGKVTSCDNASCNTAFFVPDDNQVQVECQADNVNLLITFCGDGSSSAPPASSAAPSPPAPSTTSEPSSTPAPSPTSQAVPSSTPAPSPSSVPASQSSIQPSATQSSASASSTPNRKTCKNRRRDVEDDLPAQLYHRALRHRKRSEH